MLRYIAVHCHDGIFDASGNNKCAEMYNCHVSLYNCKYGFPSITAAYLKALLWHAP
jgi:hypothetical protein